MQRYWLLVAIPVVVVVLSFAWVGGGEIAVRESYGGQAVPLAAGLHLRIPVYQRLYRYDTRPHVLSESFEIVTKDNASFRMPVELVTRVSAGDVLTFHAARSGREPGLFIEETGRAAILAAARQFNADQILLAQAAPRMSQAVSADLILRGISDDGLAFGRPEPQVIFNAVADYLNREFPASARRLAAASLESDPKESLFHAAMGVVLEAEGQADAAEQEYLEALYLNPAAPEPMSRLYLIYQTRSDEASLSRLVRLLTASVGKSPDSSVHQDWLGQAYMRLGQDDRAAIAFNRAIELAPARPEFLVSLGSLKARQSKLDEARAAFEAALKLRPDHPLALFNLGTTYAMEGQIDRALELFHRAEQGGPPNHALLNALAQAYEQRGDDRRAAEYLRRSLALRPNQPERQATLKRIEAKLRKKGR